MSKSLLKGSPKVQVVDLNFQFPVQNPFLFCVHHYDKYPAGNDNYGVDEQWLEGKNIGQDFDLESPFRMYHGDEVPGFPAHPHRGFETITIVRKGFVDHSDSVGASARYGEGDVQWLTAGGGIQHSEMFPLLYKEKPNEVELFQIWINLPKKSKMVPPHFKIFWSQDIPVAKEDGYSVQIISGKFNDSVALKPPPHSWAADSKNEVNVFLVKLNPHAKFTVPVLNNEVLTSVYIYDKKSYKVCGQQFDSALGFFWQGLEHLQIESDNEELDILILQAMPIHEPVAMHGPFVMNSREELVQAFRDYQATQFGGWGWESDGPVHGGVIERFAHEKGHKKEVAPK